MLSIEDRKEIVSTYGKNDTDTGSTEVQIVLLTSRIEYLTQHFKEHKKDHHSRRGLMKLVGSRRTLLKYLRSKNNQTYKDLISKLGLRK